MILKIDHSKNLGSVILNGVEIVKFPLAGSKWQDLVKNSKFYKNNKKLNSKIYCLYVEKYFFL